MQKCGAHFKKPESMHGPVKHAAAKKQERVGTKALLFFLMVCEIFALSQQQMLFEVMEMQSFQMCFIASDRPHVGRNREADRNERKMWNCCKTKLHFLDVLLRISALVFLFQ